MDKNIFAKLTEQYPFITLCLYASQEYVGIVQNRDDIVTTIYDFGSIQDIELKRLFLELANTWWWESNRSIPINIFLVKYVDKHIMYLRGSPSVRIVTPATTTHPHSRRKFFILNKDPSNHST